VGNHAVHVHLAQSTGRQHTAGEFKHLCEILLAIEFVDRGTADHAVHRNLAAQRRNHDGVTGLQHLDA